MMDGSILDVRDIAKDFTLHAQGGARLAVFAGVGFTLAPGDCLALSGPSGIGKSTLMRMIYGNFRCPRGEVLVRHGDEVIDVASAHPHRILDIRRTTMGYVSQFLRVIPRVATLDVVMEPALAQGIPANEARARAEVLLAQLRIPESLWGLSPVMFSGGEQQRVNLARGFAARYPLMLLDEPTASLDAENRATVIEMIGAARDHGTAIIGIFHDADARAQVCNRALDLSAYAVKAA